ncbi:MAG: peptide ABC transporter permease [Rhizobiales bacterium 65-9]|nr:ABC transporter permease [Hyphomicrobiales bacterium]OJY36490.1 MAG: peptide ABC transporter permease [Rhizobiales bacterium 65-9]
MAAVDAFSLDAPPRRRLLGAAARRLLGNRAFVTGALLLAVVVIASVLAPLITTGDPNRMAVRFRFRPPSWDFPFGTDNLGRNMLTRVLWGGRLSLEAGFWVVALNAVFGVLLGALAGYVRSFDGFLMRIVDALMAFPAVLLAIGIAAALGPSLVTVVASLAIVYIPRTARVVRASVMVARELDYVQAARSYGASDMRILMRHIMPNCLAPLIVQLSFVFAYAILSEAVLSFLGLGAPPTTPSWGILISEGRSYIREAWWLTAFPGAAIAITVLGLNLLGDGLRDVLDPHMRIDN